jgi:prefoldin subunit 5
MRIANAEKVEALEKKLDDVCRELKELCEKLERIEQSVGQIAGKSYREPS